MDNVGAIELGRYGTACELGLKLSHIPSNSHGWSVSRDPTCPSSRDLGYFLDKATAERQGQATAKATNFDKAILRHQYNHYNLAIDELPKT